MGRITEENSLIDYCTRLDFSEMLDLYKSISMEIISRAIMEDLTSIEGIDKKIIHRKFNEFIHKMEDERKCMVLFLSRFGINLDLKDGV